MGDNQPKGKKAIKFIAGFLLSCAVYLMMTTVLYYYSKYIHSQRSSQWTFDVDIFRLVYELVWIPVGVASGILTAKGSYKGAIWTCVGAAAGTILLLGGCGILSI